MTLPQMCSKVFCGVECCITADCPLRFPFVVVVDPAKRGSVSQNLPHHLPWISEERSESRACVYVPHIAVMTWKHNPVAPRIIHPVFPLKPLWKADNQAINRSLRSAVFPNSCLLLRPCDLDRSAYFWPRCFASRRAFFSNVGKAHSTIDSPASLHAAFSSSQSSSEIRPNCRAGFGLYAPRSVAGRPRLFASIVHHINTHRRMRSPLERPLERNPDFSAEQQPNSIQQRD